LIDALWFQHKSLAIFLVQANEVKNFENNDFLTPLFIADTEEDVVKVLLEAKDNPNKKIVNWEQVVASDKSVWT